MRVSGNSTPGRRLTGLVLGPVGHRITAQIAEKRLNPQTRKRLELLAGKGSTLASLANWADGIREERPETVRWHYINIPPDATELDLDRDCPGADCITVKAREFLGIVRLGLKAQEERLDALRFLIHLMGDLHQPLHAGFAHDRGGNDIPIVFHGEESNLHKLWDSDLLGKHISDEICSPPSCCPRFVRKTRSDGAEGISRNGPGSHGSWHWKRFTTGCQPRNPRPLMEITAGGRGKS